MRRLQRLLGLAIVLAGTAGARADGPAPATRYQVVSPKPVGIIATALNARGDLVGFEWVEETERPGVLEQKAFFARGKAVTYLPLLRGYTATFPAGVSDDGTVVGRSSRPAPPGGPRVHLRNQAFIWDAAGGIRGLGVCEGDSASFASGIARDGRRISGFSVGDNRIRACVWDRVGVGGGWKATPLPHADRLGSYVVPISNDGKQVAGTDGALPCLWSRDDAGTWTRTVLGGPASLTPRAVNNAGTVVGFHATPDGRNHAVVWTRDAGLKPLAEPPGYESSEALALNDAGVVVGTVDGPHGGPIGPNAFVHEAGRLRLLDEGGPLFSAATALNDNRQVAGVLEEREDHEPAPTPTPKPAKP